MKLTKQMTAVLLSAVIFCTLLLVSCTDRESGNILWYQKYPLKAKISVGGVSMDIAIDTEGNGEIAVRDGELAGTSFALGKGGLAHIIAGDIKIPLPKGGEGRLRSVLGAFKLSRDKIASVTTDGSITTAVISGDGGSYTVRLDEAGAPIDIAFDGDGGYLISVDQISAELAGDEE